jgi:hypothetical protein
VGHSVRDRHRILRNDCAHDCSRRSSGGSFPAAVGHCR